MTAEARARVNELLGSRRMLSHAIFTPGQPGWMDEVERAIAEDRPDSFKGYTIGDNTHKELSRYPWRMDDEKLLYPFYEKAWKAGIRNICVHKGLFPPSVETAIPASARLLRRARRGQGGERLADAELHHLPRGLSLPRRRHAGRGAGRVREERARRLGHRSRRDPREVRCAATSTATSARCSRQPPSRSRSWPLRLMGTLVKGLGADRVVWGSDAVWTGAPQWQIEGLRRLEIPEDMQAKYGFAPLGPATGPVKSAIFGETSARLYGIEPTSYAGAGDRLASAQGGLPQRRQANRATCATATSRGADVVEGLIDLP